MDLDLGIISEAEKRSKKKLLLDYLYANLKNHNFWAYRYFFCEFLALANVIGEFFFSFDNCIWLKVYSLDIEFSFTGWFFEQMQSQMCSKNVKIVAQQIS